MMRISGKSFWMGAKKARADANKPQNKIIIFNKAKGEQRQQKKSKRTTKKNARNSENQQKQ